MSLYPSGIRRVPETIEILRGNIQIFQSRNSHYFYQLSRTKILGKPVSKIETKKISHKSIDHRLSSIGICINRIHRSRELFDEIYRSKKDRNKSGEKVSSPVPAISLFHQLCYFGFYSL